MLENEGAGTGGEDSSGQAGSGAPAGGSPEGGSENDDKPITAKQLKAILASQERGFNEKLAAKDAEFEAFKAGISSKGAEPKQELPRTYTRAELAEAVKAESITQAQADDIWDRQREAEITEKATKAATAAVSGKAAAQRITADLSKYKRLAPEILQTGSEERLRIVNEFNQLVDDGMPRNLATELAAIRAVMGPLDRLEKARSAQRSVESEQQGGGSGKGMGGKGKTLADQLNPRAREYYEGGIKSGRYKDWKAVEDELKYASPARRQSLGLSA